MLALVSLGNSESKTRTYERGGDADDAVSQARDKKSRSLAGPCFR